MKKPLLAAAVVACLVAGSIVAQLAAQNPGARPPGAPTGAPPSVAVVDVEKIFKDLASFKTQMELMQREVKGAEDKLNLERLQINKLIEQLKESGLKGTAVEYRKQEAVIAQKQADFQVRKQLQTRDLMEREASVYYKTYVEINEQIRLYAESRGITLVLRYSANPVDPTDRESVFRELSKPVVYQHSSDITQIIVDDLNRRNNLARRPDPNHGGPPLNTNGAPANSGGLPQNGPPGAGGPPRGNLPPR